MSHLLLFWFQKRTVAIDTLPEIIGFRVFQDINESVYAIVPPVPRLYEC